MDLQDVCDLLELHWFNHLSLEVGGEGGTLPLTEF
jgi:hypothetical protein